MLTTPARCLLLALLVALAVATPAQARGYQGKVLLHCAPQAAQQADPLTSFGVSPGPNLNTPGGATGTFGPSETLTILEANVTTSCDLGSDWSQIWVPTPLQANGTPATIRDIGYYLINNAGQTISPIADFNPGFHALYGNPTCAATSCDSAAFYCNGNRQHFPTIPTVAECPLDGYQETIHPALGGQCWDGASLGEGMGDTTGAANLAFSNGPCPDLTIPSLVLSLEVEQNGVGGYLSSDLKPTTCPGCSAHFEYAFDFPSAALQAIVTGCMYQPAVPQGIQTCGEGPAAPGATGTSSIYQVDPTNDRAEDGLHGEPDVLITS